MTDKQRTWGQFATPTDVADLILGFCLRRPSDRLLDPSCGDGDLLRRAAQWVRWLEAEALEEGHRSLYGVELDVDVALAAAASADSKIPGLTINQANFFTLGLDDLPRLDAIVGNPPYTRAEWIGRLDEAAEAQPSLFAEGAAPANASGPTPLLPAGLREKLNQRAGLHAYFLLHSHQFLRPGGRLGLVVPNGWLDVAYGTALKQFLLDHFRILAIIESAVERWFETASVNTCVLILERADNAADRVGNRVRFVSLRQPLRDMLASDSEDPYRVIAVEQLAGRLLPPTSRQNDSMSVRVIEQGELDPAGRWGQLWRAPDVIRRHAPALVPLNQWAGVQRGLTTGANDFYYLTTAIKKRWDIEPRFRQPLLKSLRRIDSLRLDATACDHEWLAIPSHADLSGTRVASYLAWGISEGIHQRRTCAARQPWYVLGEQSPAAVLVAKGIWQRHFAPLLDEPIAVDQQIYRIVPAPGIEPQVAAALLNSAWFALQCELHGRLNLGEGVLWLATYELGEIELPDPRLIDATAAARLVESFRRLAQRPIVDIADDLTSPDRYQLDEQVFDLIGLNAAERDSVRRSLVDCLRGRRLRARSHQAG